MIRYKITNELSDCIISLDSGSPSQPAEIKITGKGENEVKAWLLTQYGAFGHLIRERTTPIDLDSALKGAKDWKVELLEGAGLVASYALPGLPPEALT
jgi:hypothetical protein